MNEKLLEKLGNLSEKFMSDIDIITLKALASSPESEEISLAIQGALERLKEKYQGEEEILRLFPEKERISLEELLAHLTEAYPSHIDVITIKALTTLAEGTEKEEAIKGALNRILEQHTEDNKILEYLGMDRKEKRTTPKNENFVIVKGGKYVASFMKEEREVIDLEVCKYPVTQDMWQEIMGDNPSKFKGGRRPVECVSWIGALKYCNALSEKEGLEPVYVIENEDYNNFVLKINQLDGESVYPDLADFKQTEGYRLPTELEWEWFARGGEVAIQDDSFNSKYAGSDNIAEVAWYDKNSGDQTHAVGGKKPNELGLYDCSGNVWEWCYDTSDKGYISEERPYIYDSSVTGRMLSGGSWCLYGSNCVVFFRLSRGLANANYDCGFRPVRTI